MSSPLSISLWFKPDELVGYQQIILTKPNEYQLLINGNAEIIFQISINGIVWDSAVSVNLSLVTNEWYHVAVWITPGDQIGICINGGTPDVQSLNPGECAYVGGSPILLGHRSSDSSSSSSSSDSNSSNSSSSESGPVDFIGSIDEMAFFLRTLLPTELESLYNDGDGYFYRSGVWTLCPGSFGAFSAMASPPNPLLAVSALESEVDRQYVWGARSGHRDELILRDDSTVISSSSVSEASGRLWCLMDYYDPTAVVDNSGTVIERYRFSAFGPRSILNADFILRPASLCAWDFAFKGQFLDADTSYYNYGYRYYSPQLGRWLSRDPIGEKGGSNLFCFVTNNPLNRHDSYGLNVVIDCEGPTTIGNGEISWSNGCWTSDITDLNLLVVASANLRKPSCTPCCHRTTVAYLSSETNKSPEGLLDKIKCNLACDNAAGIVGTRAPSLITLQAPRAGINLGPPCGSSNCMGSEESLGSINGIYALVDIATIPGCQCKVILSSIKFYAQRHSKN